MPLLYIVFSPYPHLTITSPGLDTILAHILPSLHPLYHHLTITLPSPCLQLIFTSPSPFITLPSPNLDFTLMVRTSHYLTFTLPSPYSALTLKLSSPYPHLYINSPSWFEPYITLSLPPAYPQLTPTHPTLTLTLPQPYHRLIITLP